MAAGLRESCAELCIQLANQEKHVFRDVFARSWEELKTDQQHAGEVEYPILFVQDFHDPNQMSIDIFVMLADLVHEQRGRG